jgi:acetoin:2,6-dichlorophenolindophenol oxidoreductase subunit alpha
MAHTQNRAYPPAEGGEEELAEPDADREEWLHMYEQMAKIRAFEEHVNELYQSAKMPGLAHLYIGEEAIAVGVCEALRRDDYITSTHRGHGHCLAKGAAVDKMFCELLGKEPGYCRGKGGSMHIADQDTGNLGARRSRPAQHSPASGSATGAWRFVSSARARWARACSMSP